MIQRIRVFGVKEFVKRNLYIYTYPLLTYSVLLISIYLYN